MPPKKKVRDDPGNTVSRPELPDSMKDAFTIEEYKELLRVLPDWETSLKRFNPSTIAFELADLGFPPLKTSAMALSIVVHLNPGTGLANAVIQGDSELAIALLTSIAKHNSCQRDDNELYARPRHFPETWASEEWQVQLFQGRAALDGLGSRPMSSSRVIGFWSGTGCGKSHRLMQLRDFAPRKHIEAYEADATHMPLSDDKRQRVDVPAVDCFVYITYTNQKLTFDRHKPALAILLRVLMRDVGLSNEACDSFLCDNADVLKTIVNETSLVQVCVKHFSAKAQHIGIAVDDLRKLLVNNEDTESYAVNATKYCLGNLAPALEGAGVACTAVFSLMASQNLAHMGSRPPTEVFIPAVDADGIRFVIQHGLPGKQYTAKNTAKIMAVSGCHFRSAVHAVDLVKEDSTITPERLLEEVYSRMGTSLQCAEREYIRQHILGKMATGQGVHDHRQRFVDREGAVAPPFVATAFRKEEGFKPNKHPAEKFFEAAAIDTAPKQLQECGVHYDMLRALYDLPVVPRNIGVHADQKFRNIKDYRYTTSIGKAPVSSDSMFENKGGVVRVVPGWSPPNDRYMLPAATNHPLVDRACVAFHPTSRERCLIIYKDKPESVTEAVRTLSEAATLLEAQIKYPVLCVAHIVPVSEKKQLPRDLLHPFVLVTEEHIECYYTPTFARPIQHLLHRQKEEMCEEQKKRPGNLPPA